MNAIPMIPTIDESRPRKLADNHADTKRCSQLHYVYLDTGEEVTVTNVWHNQPPRVLAENLKEQATRLRSEADKAMLDTGLSPEERKAKRDQCLSRAQESMELAAIHDDRDTFMTHGFYSCSMPPPDRQEFRRTREALDEYYATQPERDASLARVECDQDYQAWLAKENEVVYAAQLAFYLDTSDINSRDSCRLMYPSSIRDLVNNIAKQNDHSYRERERA